MSRYTTAPTTNGCTHVIDTTTGHPVSLCGNEAEATLLARTLSAPRHAPRLRAPAALAAAFVAFFPTSDAAPAA